MSRRSTKQRCSISPQGMTWRETLPSGRSMLSQVNPLGTSTLRYRNIGTGWRPPCWSSQLSTDAKLSLKHRSGDVKIVIVLHCMALQDPNTSSDIQRLYSQYYLPVAIRACNADK